jgi:hypothetical protein
MFPPLLPTAALFVYFSFLPFFSYASCAHFAWRCIADAEFLGGSILYTIATTAYPSLTSEGPAVSAGCTWDLAMR